MRAQLTPPDLPAKLRVLAAAAADDDSEGDGDMRRQCGVQRTAVSALPPDAEAVLQRLEWTRKAALDRLQVGAAAAAAAQVRVYIAAVAARTAA